MREILFRGMTEKGKWIEGDLYQSRLKSIFMISRYSEHGNRMTEVVNPETVGQFTGLTDKNGKKIFEGDIVRADGYIFVVKFGKCGGVPNTDNYGYMGFYLEALSEGTKLCAKYGMRDDICYFEDIEVIYNIHDNPELLEIGKE